MVDVRRLYATTDAQVWAEEFMLAFGWRQHQIDEDLMVTWFANAIETGRQAGERRVEHLVAENERLSLALIEARNPGIDIDEVRRRRAEDSEGDGEL